MPQSGDSAPSFTATAGTSDHEPFDFDDHLGDGPVVLAFFPGAFTPPCSNEMVALDDRIDEFRDADATVLGVSADSPFALGAFRDEYDLDFDLVSDMARDAIDAYGLEIDVAELGLYGVANRAVYVLDDDGTVVYDWEADEPPNEPPYDDVVDAAKDA